MPRVLFAAHDTGGANILVPIFNELLETGYDIRFYTSGPAVRVLAEKAVSMVENQEDIDAVVNEFDPKIIITGTSDISDFERIFWKKAKSENILSFALLDAWINIKRRFSRCLDDDNIQPDILGVIDQNMKQEIERSEWCKASLQVTGQTHLESVASRINSLPQLENNEGVKLLFISEPILEKGLTEELGYNQYQIAEHILTSLSGSKLYELIVKPHPNESSTHWINWEKKRSNKNSIKVLISNENVEELIASTNLVLGIASMSLIEAAAAGKSVLAIQPSEAANPNPAIKNIGNIRILNNINDIERFVNRILRKKENNAEDTNISSVFNNSKSNVLKIIKDNLR